MIGQEPEAPFDRLLRWLDANRDQAGVVYEQLRVKLMRFFEHHGCWEAEDCADETLQRVAQKLSEGLEVRADDPYVYCRGVAHNIMLEQRREQARAPGAIDDLLPPQHPAVHPDEMESRQQEKLRHERLLECLDRCLAALPSESHQLFIAYYQDERRAKIDHRLLLAERLGIDITALRNRLTRLRKKIESCVSECARQRT